MSNILPYEESGKKSSNQILVFLHGWPDTPELWDKITPAFDKDYFILNITYPNFSEKEKNPKGVDFEEMSRRIKATIDYVNDTKRKVVIVSHDWGSIYGYYIDHLYPKYIHQMIALDVGAKFSLKKFITIFYQLWLVIAFLIGSFIGNYMTQWMVKLLKYQPRWKNKINSSWNYPYYYIWKKMVKAGFKEEKAILSGYQPSCPIAFAWGTKKPIQFFNTAWVQMLVKNPKNEIHSLKCGHWIPREQSNFVIDLILRRIQEY